MSNVDEKVEKPIQHDKKSTHIPILDCGFAGIEVLKLGKNNIDITLVSRDNFLLFTLLLPQYQLKVRLIQWASLFYEISQQISLKQIAIFQVKAQYEEMVLSLLLLLSSPTPLLIIES